MKKKPAQSRRKAKQKPRQAFDVLPPRFVRAVVTFDPSGQITDAKVEPVEEPTLVDMLPMKSPSFTDTMTDKPLPWPRHAGEDRDLSAEDAQLIDRTLTSAIEATHDPALIKMLSRAKDAAVRILRRMEHHGAPTRP